jgi:cadmium resistance protein CadD (predicted permease)
MNTSALIGLGIIIFTATNVDDMLVLLGFFGDPAYRPQQVVLGQYLGIAALYGVSVIAACVSLLVPPVYVGLLGFAPIGIGAAKLSQSWRGKPPDAEASGSPAGYGKTAAVALVTIANGGDNIATYTPVFAVHSAREIALIGVIFLLMTGLWCALSYRLLGHRGIGGPIRRYGSRILPYILIGLGLIILWKAKTAVLIGL